MKLPPRFVLVIEGEIGRVNSRALIVPTALPHLLGYLLTGQEIDPNVFRPFGLRVMAEVDTDGGEEIEDPPASR